MSPTRHVPALLTIALIALVLIACFFKPERVDLIDGSPIDGGIDAVTMNPCVDGPCNAAGGTCDAGGTCVIIQTTSAGVICPATMPCRVECLAADSCRDGVDCGNATSCEVRCEGTSACQDWGVHCGSAAICTVRCIGDNACQNGQGSNASIECGDAVCAVTCDGANACQDGVNVGALGTCVAHCCNGGCPAPVVDPSCSRDTSCAPA